MCVCVPPQVKGGVAEADGRLMPGDQILSVNGQDFRNMKQEDAATLMKVTVGTFRNKETVDCGYGYVWYIWLSIVCIEYNVISSWLNKIVH